MSDQEDEFDRILPYQPVIPKSPFDPDFTGVFGGQLGATGEPPVSSGTFYIDPADYKQWNVTTGPAIVRAQEAAITPFCNHVPIDVGFSRSKIVCKKCDKEL